MVGAKPAVQERSRKTREALLNAMERLLRSEDFASLSVARLAEEAGVSPASIYQRFSNRDALVAILVELYMQRVEAWQASAPPPPAGADLRGVCAHVGATSWDMVEQLGHVMRPAYLMSRLRPDLAGEEWERLQQLAHAGFRHMLEMHRAELHGGDPAQLAAPIAMQVNMMLVARLLHWPEAATDGIPANREAFGEMIADQVLGYIRVAAEGGRA